MSSRPGVEFWFDFTSLYSYPAVMRVEALAQAHGRSVLWRPFLLGPVFRALGWQGPPLFVHSAKGDYAWRDVARRCRLHGLPFQRPPAFPMPSVLALRVATLGVDAPWIGAFCREVMRVGFGEARAIDSEDVLGSILRGLGLAPGEVLARATSDSNKAALRARTEEATARGIFGAPMTCVDGEMFWGDDRLEEAMAWEGGDDADPS